MTFTCAVTLIALGFGCTADAAKAPPPPISSYCQIARPITWSAQDTRATKEKVDIHNRVWKRLCRMG